jgi:hypothetical protein
LVVLLVLVLVLKTACLGEELEDGEEVSEEVVVEEEEDMGSPRVGVW